MLALMSAPTFIFAFVWHGQRTLAMPHVFVVFTGIAATIRPSVFAFALSLPVNKIAFELVSRLLFFFLVLLGWCWICHSSLQRNKGSSECKVSISETLHVISAYAAVDPPARVIPAHEACRPRQTLLTISAHHKGCQWYSRLLGRQHYLRQKSHKYRDFLSFVGHVYQTCNSSRVQTSKMYRARLGARLGARPKT